MRDERIRAHPGHRLPDVVVHIVASSRACSVRAGCPFPPSEFARGCPVFIDSAGIHVLFDLFSRLRNRGQEMRLVMPSGAAIAEALRIVGIPPTIQVSETTDEALASIGGEVTRTGN